MNKASISRIGRQDTFYRLRVAMDSRLPKPDQMQLTAPVLVELPYGLEVILPAGFITDCHSIPPWLGSVLPEYDNRTNVAAIVHDYLYMHWEEFLEQNNQSERAAQYPDGHRKVADHCYYALMQQFHPGGWRNHLYFYAVRLLGGFNWRKFRQINKYENDEKSSENQQH